uniref:Uncharacterized protein n=1 Tax=Pseudomonas phage HRDY3 TaxID=3236930 RepID=A0AB39CE39_9VIRU
MKEMVIASNMIALARNHKEQAKKRSAMLRMIMPLLSKETGDKLANAISKQDTRHFIKLWDHIKREITHKLDAEHHKHKHHLAVASMGDITREEWAAMHPGECAAKETPARLESPEPTYADVTTFQRDDETSISITTYGPRKIRISLNGNTVLETQPTQGVPPAVAQGEEVPTPAYPASIEQCINTEQICKLVKMVCERLLMQADPCPLPPRLMKMPENCAEHDWPDCKVCLHGIKGFDFNANILELYDKLCASSI